MKKMIVALLMLAVSHAQAASFGQTLRDGYFYTIFQDPAHPKTSAKFLFTPKAIADGGLVEAVFVGHNEDPKRTLWPQKLLDAGVKPMGWTLLACGVGGNKQSAFISCGTGLDVAPTLIGPLADRLKSAGGTYATFGSLLLADNGDGLNLSLDHKVSILSNAEMVPFNQLRFVPRYGLGYRYSWGKPAANAPDQPQGS